MNVLNVIIPGSGGRKAVDSGGESTGDSDGAPSKFREGEGGGGRLLAIRDEKRGGIER